jgi:CRP-like cAMP-binding protein
MASKTKTFPPGEVIIKEGSSGTSAYVILAGEVDVTKKVKGKDVVIATLSKGQVFGEMGLLEDRLRSATVTVRSELNVREINRDDFNALLVKDPLVLVPILKSLFEKLRQTTNMLAKSSSDIGRAPTSATGVFRVILSGHSPEAKKVLDNKEIEIRKFPFLIGRYSANVDLDVFYMNDIAIKEKKPYRVSRNHLAIVKEGGEILVTDRGSAYGAIVNSNHIGGKSSDACARLKAGNNRITVGDTLSRFTFNVEVMTP